MKFHIGIEYDSQPEGEILYSWQSYPIPMRNFMCLTSFTQIKEKDVKQMKFRIGIEYNCYQLEI